MNESSGMLAAVVFQSKASEESLLRTAKHLFFLSFSFTLLSLLVPLVKSSFRYGPFFAKSGVRFLSMQKLAPYSNATASFWS